METEHKLNAFNNNHDLERATRIISCMSESCTRAIIEYSAGPESRHDHLPDSLMTAAVAIGRIDIIELPCDHHGGQEYERRGLQ
jgi:hypothetical protein